MRPLMSRVPGPTPMRPMRFHTALIVLVATSGLAWSGDGAAADSPRVALHTTKGVIVVELDDEKAPKTVQNFLNYVRQRYYDGMIFHRVIDDWVIQSGGHTKDLAAYETDPPIRSEAANGLKNERGTIAMARGMNPHSADSQFFINLDDNDSLDHYGYCVFGRVVKGMEVADAIGDVETHSHEGFDDLPVDAVVIRKARLVR